VEKNCAAVGTSARIINEEKLVLINHYVKKEEECFLKPGARILFNICRSTIKKLKEFRL
jgi:hypothetical protein